MSRQNAVLSVFRLLRSCDLLRSNGVLMPRGGPATAPKVALKLSAAIQHCEIPMIPSSPRHRRPAPGVFADSSSPHPRAKGSRRLI